MLFKNARDTAAVIKERCGSGPTPKTMDKWRCCGGGPPYVRRGRHGFYNIDSAVSWWLASMSNEVGSTSEYMPAAPSHLIDLKRLDGKIQKQHNKKASS